ncbi:MAG: ribosomal-processing cysteine protease Prp [Selenomonadaceae bacterium]|nr:ribosomal-processing cysteine protease Prp [Selenomonadaceae bacterium]
MIVAEIYTQTDGKIFGFSIDGHSNTAPRGYDIYCAGVSTVAQAAFMCIDEHLKRDFQCDFASGKLSLILDDPPDELTEAVFQTMLIGIREIEKLAPQAVKLIIKKKFPA